MQIFIMIKIPIQTLFTMSIILTTVLGDSDLINQRTYGHNFTPNETASFLAFAYQLQVESELVKVNLLTNNISLAQNHANKVASLLTPTILAEIVEKDPGIANDLRSKVNDLLRISSTTKNQQEIENVLTEINSTLTKAVNIRISQGSADSSNFLDKATEFLSGMFQTSSNQIDITAGANSTVLALSFADLVDSALVNYGNAFGVEFDMTNMSNMMGSNDEMKMGSINMSSNGGMSMVPNIHSNYSLRDISDYQSAQALSKKAYDIFNSKLRPLTINENYTDSFVSNLDNGLSQLDTSISRKASPMDIMMIAHTEIHPNLLAIFNLGSRDI
jgi:hypothetical protein